MIRFTRVICAATALLAATPVFAADVSAPLIAIVDLQAVMREAKAPQGVINYRNKLDSQYQQEFATEEKKLAETDQDLARQRSVLAPEAFGEKLRAFQAQANDFAQRAQTRKRNLERAFGVAMGQVAQGVNKVIAQIASEKGYNLVLPRQQVEFYDTRLDITKEVIERTNATVKEVNFPDPTKDFDASGKAVGKEAPKDAKKAPAPAAKDKK